MTPGSGQWLAVTGGAPTTAILAPVQRTLRLVDGPVVEHEVAENEASRVRPPAGGS